MEIRRGFRSQEEADAFLRESKTQSGRCFDVFSFQLKRIAKIRKRKKLNLENRKELALIYHGITSFAKYGSVGLFREIVPEQEIAAWFDHVEEILQQKINDQHWIRTGELPLHDEQLLVSYSAFLCQPLPAAMAFENTIVLETISSMIISRKGGSDKLPGERFVYKLTLLVCDILDCAMSKFDNIWKPERVFRKLEATGILEEFLHCATKSMQPKFHAVIELRKLIFRQLLRSTKFVKKRLKRGTPCGDALMKILARGDSPSAICSQTLPLFQTLMKLSTFLRIEREEICPHCSKRGLFVNYMHCGRCKQVDYCSKECQKADWKDHKTECFESSSSRVQLPRIANAAIWQILKAAYVDIMVGLVKACESAGGLKMNDMVLDLDFTPDENGRIAMLQDPPQFAILPFARYQDGTRPRECISTILADDEAVNVVVEKFTKMVSLSKSRAGIRCFELHPNGVSSERHQIYINDRPMFTQEALDTFRVAWLDDNYGQLLAIFEDQEIIESYKQEIRRLRIASAKAAKDSAFSSRGP